MLVASLGAAAHAAETRAPGQGADLMVPLVDAPPWNYYGPDCEAQGIGIEVVREISAAAGLTMIDVPEALIPALGATGTDKASERPSANLVVLSASPPQAGMQQVPGVLFDVALALYPVDRRRRPVDVGLGGVRVGFVARERFVQAQLEARGVEGVAFVNYASLIEGLRDGRIDRVIGLREGIAFGLLSRGETPTAARSIRTLSTHPVTMHVASGLSADGLRRLEEAIATFRAEGRYQAIRDRFLSRATAGRLAVRHDCATE